MTCKSLAAAVPHAKPIMQIDCLRCRSSLICFHETKRARIVRPSIVEPRSLAHSIVFTSSFLRPTSKSHAVSHQARPRLAVDRPIMTVGHVRTLLARVKKLGRKGWRPAGRPAARRQLAMTRNIAFEAGTEMLNAFLQTAAIVSLC